MGEKQRTGLANISETAKYLKKAAIAEALDRMEAEIIETHKPVEMYICES